MKDRSSMAFKVGARELGLGTAKDATDAWIECDLEMATQMEEKSCAERL